MRMGRWRGGQQQPVRSAGGACHGGTLFCRLSARPVRCAAALFTCLATLAVGVAAQVMPIAVLYTSVPVSGGD